MYNWEIVKSQMFTLFHTPLFVSEFDRLALVKAHEAQDLKNDRLNLFFAEIWDGR
jgi:hypothetical protein